MTEFMAKLKAWAWYALFLAVAFIAGFLVCLAVDPFGPSVTGISTNTNAALAVVHPPLTDVQQNELALMTNRLERPRFVNDYDKSVLNVTFLVDYRLSGGQTIAMTWSERIQAPRTDYSGWMFGGGWDIIRAAPAALVGYHWNWFAVLGTVTVSTNFGAAVYGVWMPF